MKMYLPNEKCKSKSEEKKEKKDKEDQKKQMLKEHGLSPNAQILME